MLQPPPSSAARAEYSRGWPEVLRLYQAFTAPARDEPGPAAPEHFSEIISHVDNTRRSGNTSPAETERARAPGQGGTGEDDGEATWVALEHRAGPAASPDVSLFAQPQFRKHIAFLQRMADQGYLIAAGPLPEELGSGMAILRLPGAGRLAEATRLATEEDASVGSGFFTVTVRPWQVMLTGSALNG